MTTVRLYRRAQQGLVATAATLTEPRALTLALDVVLAEPAEGSAPVSGVLERTFEDLGIGIVWILDPEEDPTHPLVIPAGAFEIGNEIQRARALAVASGLRERDPSTYLMAAEPRVVFVRGVTPIPPGELQVEGLPRPVADPDGLVSFRHARGAVLALDLYELELTVVLAIGTSDRTAASALATSIRELVEALGRLERADGWGHR